MGTAAPNTKLGDLGSEYAAEDVPGPAWTAACERFWKSHSLSDTERKMLTEGSFDAVRRDLLALDTQHVASSRFRRFTTAIRLKSFLDGVANLDTALSSLTSADPHGVAQLVWGSVRLVCNAVKGVLNYMADMLEFLNRIGSALSRLQLYEKLVPKSVRLNRCLFKIFIRYLEFCSYLRDAFIKDGAPRLSRMVTWKSTTESFKNTMADKIADIDKLCTDAHLEAQLSVAEAQLKAAKSLHGALGDLSLEGKGVREDNIEFRRKQRMVDSKQNFLAWLGQVPTQEDFDKFKMIQLENTCQWIENDPQISSWLHSAKDCPSLLWLSAPPGTGKTIITTHIVNQLLGRCQVAYFFCRIDDDRKRTTLAVLSNWIWQLVHNSQVLPEEVTKPSDQHQSPTIPILRGILESLQDFLKPLWLVVDGLDECEDELIDFLECCHSLSKKWRVLVVSRDIPDIRTHLKDSRVQHKAMTAHDNAADIHDYVLHKIISAQDTRDDLDNLVSVRAEELVERKGWSNVQASITDVLSSSAEGMFLWVKLVFDFLLNEATLLDDIDDILHNVPFGLNKIYERIMTKIASHPSRKKIAQRAFEWIIYTLRPPTLDELHAALSIESNMSKPISNFESLLRESCGPLIKINERTNEIGFMHATVLEYLVSRVPGDPIILNSAEIVHANITRICLSYICSKCRNSLHVDDNIENSDKAFQEHLGIYHLLDYSAVYWVQHAQRSKSSIQEWKESLRQLSRSEDLLISWLQIFRYLYALGRLGTLDSDKILQQALWPAKSAENADLRDALSQEGSEFLYHLGIADGNRFMRWDRLIQSTDIPKCVPATLIAAHFNFLGYVRKEISRRKWPVDKCVSRSGTALLWAARTDSTSTVQYLLAQGAAVNYISPYSGETAIFKAISIEPTLRDFPNGSYPIIPLLLEAGADLDSKDHHDWGVLHVLLNSKKRDGESEVLLAKEIIKRNPKLCIQSHPRVGTFLRYAILRNLPHILKGICDEMLVENPQQLSQILERRFDSDTPLHLALRQQPQIVPLLLDMGANMNARDAQKLSPIEIAVRNDQWMNLKEFIGRGIDVISEGSQGPHLLETALKVQSKNSIKTLLDFGVAARHIPNYLLLLPRSFELDKRIRDSKPKDFPWPLSARDIYQICFHLQTFHGIPIPVTAKILDLAEIWLQSTVIRNDIQTVTQNDPQLPFVVSAPIEGRMNSPVQKVELEITSHDQGFDDSNGESGSWTWFETRHISKSEDDSPRLGAYQGSIYNVSGDFNWRTSHVTWSSLEGNETKKSNQPPLCPGDQIDVVPRARFPGWTNYVAAMRLDIYTSLLRQHYTREETLGLWGAETRPGKLYSDCVAGPPTSITNALFLPQTSSGFRILASEYGGSVASEPLTEAVDVAAQALTLNTDNLSFLPDPWYGVIKSLSVMFQYGESKPQLLITAQGRGTITISPNSPRMECSGLRRSRHGTDVLVLAIVYGAQEIIDEYVHQNVLAAIVQQRSYLISNLTLGGDSWLNNAKSCAVYYRRKIGGLILCACGREDEYLHFNT